MRVAASLIYDSRGHSWRPAPFEVARFEMMRERLVFLAGKAKQSGVFDLALRYNPVVRLSVRDAIVRCRADEPRMRQSITDRLTVTIIRHARQSRYGSRFQNELANWPILSKDEVRNHPNDFVVPGFLRIPAATGGTTGIPLRLNRSLSCVAAEQVFLDNLLTAHELSWARARVAVLRGDSIKDTDDFNPPFGKLTHWGRRLILSSPHLTGATINWYHARLGAFRPDILYAWPSVLANLLMLLEQSDKRLRVPLVVTSSEVLDTSLYAAIERELGATVIDYYGLAERSAFAVRYGRDQWFFEPAYGKVELIPSTTDQIDGLRHYVPIIATGYWNDAQPLIRYDTGDRAIVAAGLGNADLEAIAIGERPFFGIAGRENDFILAPDGRRIAGLNQIARELWHALRVQLVQDALDHVTIRVIATREFGSRDGARLMANARAKLSTSTSIDIKVVDRLETTQQGKTPFVIRLIDTPVPPNFL
jgi:phenylacetate-CoA ligase